MSGSLFCFIGLILVKFNKCHHNSEPESNCLSDRVLNDYLDG